MMMRIIRSSGISMLSLCSVVPLLLSLLKVVVVTDAFVVTPGHPSSSSSSYNTRPAIKGAKSPKGRTGSACASSTILHMVPSDEEEPSKKAKKRTIKKKTTKTSGTNKKGNTPTATTPSTPPPPPPSTPVKQQQQQQQREVVQTIERELPKTSHRPRPGIDTSLLGDLTGGRPGAIIESEEDLARKREIFDEIENGDRDHYDAQTMKDHGTVLEDLEVSYDTDDPDALDMATLGTWDIKDLQSKFPYEWDPEDPNERDPNQIELEQSGMRYKKGVDVDEEGIDIGYNPMYGQSNPQDERTIMGSMESYMIDERTKDDKMLPPQFPNGDLEIEYNQDIVQFRRSLDIIETYTDEFLGPDYEIPRHVAKWHGYPEPMSYPAKPESNNRFLEDTPNPTDWSKLDPARARQKAVELARAQNADWLPQGKSQKWHASQRAPYEKIGTLVGTLRPGPIDEELKTRIQPCLSVLGNVAELLSIEGEEQTVFRFHYHGLMKNRFGMAAWTETMIQDCGVPVTGVVFETGFRRRDMAYDGGDCWYPPSS